MNQVFGLEQTAKPVEDVRQFLATIRSATCPAKAFLPRRLLLALERARP